MAKEKQSSKAAAVSSKSTASKPLESVKDGRVNKVAEKAKNVAKETAKKTAKAIEKKSKKAKEPTPEPDSESDSEDEVTSDSSVSSDEESDDDEVHSHPKVNGTAKATAEDSDEDSEEDDEEEDSDSSDGSDSDDEPAPTKSNPTKVNGIANGKVSSKHNDDSSEASSDDDEDDEEDEKPKLNGTKNIASDDDDDEDEDNSDSDDDSGSDDSSDEDEEEAAAPKVDDTKKRKADGQPEQTPKKAKTEGSAGIANLFVGNLSWNVDEEWLTREFESYGELKSVRIITNYDTGRSKGFGYVEFINAEDAAQAHADKNGSDLDGRTLNVDFSTPRANRSDGGTPQQKSFDRAKKFGDKVNEPSSTLFVGNISFDADEYAVTQTFQEYGSIKAVRLPTDRESGQPKGFGYVEMSSVDEAKAALEALQGADLAGRPIRLDYAGARPNDSPGGRGGFGGRGRGAPRGGRGGFGDRGGRGGRGGGRGGFSTNRGGFGDFSGKKTTF